MSEFSASFHLRTDNKEDAIHLIRNSNKQGYVFEEANGWVTFVVDGPAFDIDEGIIAHNPGTLVHYIFMEDHGWELRIYKGSELAFEYQCDWTDEIMIEKGLFDLGVVKELILGQGHSTEGIEAIFEMTDYDFEEPPAYQLAEKLGLVHYEWISADNIAHYESEERVVAVN